VSGTTGVAAPGALPGRVARIKRHLQDGAHAAVEPLVALLARLGVHADHLTIAGLVLSALAGFALESRFGAFLDSTLDRLSEALVLLGILGFYLRNLYALVLHPEQALLQISSGLDPRVWAVMAFTAALAMVGSFMVSYTRARAEGLGLDCKVGWFERPERLVLLVLAGLLRVFWAMSAALLLLAILSFATAAQRVAHVHRNTRRAGKDQLGG
jgi:phosphatidylglycerophosphate synthase